MNFYLLKSMAIFLLLSASLVMAGEGNQTPSGGTSGSAIGGGTTLRDLSIPSLNLNRSGRRQELWNPPQLRSPDLTPYGITPLNEFRPYTPPEIDYLRYDPRADIKQISNFDGYEFQVDYKTGKIIRTNYVGFGATNSIFNDCGVKAQDYLSAIQTFTDVKQCWQGNISPDMTPSSNQLFSSNFYLRQQYETCNCLRNQTFPSVANLMNLSSASLPNYNPPATVIEAFKKHADNVMSEIEHDRNGLAFQASTISNSDENMANLYAQDSSLISSVSATPRAELNSVGRRTANTLGRILRAHGGLNREVLTENIITSSISLSAGQVGAAAGVFSAQVTPRAGNQHSNTSITIDPITNKAELSNQIQEVLGDFKIPPRTTHLFRQGNLPDGQCVDGREYLAYRQLPSDPLLLAELSETTLDTFNADDWDAQRLRYYYDTFMILPEDERLAHKQEILKLKAKLIYLNKNPMIKAMLGANTTAPSMGDEVEIARVNFALPEMKKKLFEILKNSVSGSGVDSSRIDKMNEDLKAFYLQPLVVTAMGMESDKDAQKKINKLQDVKNLGHETKDFSAIGVESEFMSISGFSTPPSECNRPDADHVKCVEVFAAYCKNLDNIIPKLPSSTTDEAIIDNIDELSRNDFNPTMTNPEFKRFNDLICNTPRTMSPNGTGSDASDFQTFKADYCKRSSRRNICGQNTSENNAVIRGAFLAKYKYSPRLDDSDAQDVMNFASSFSRGVKDLSKEPSGEEMSSSEQARLAANIRKDMGIEEDTFNFTPGGNRSVAETEKNSLVNFARSIDSGNQAMSSGYDSGSEDSLLNYSNMSNIVAQTQGNETRVENMSDTQKEDLLDSWKQDYESWKTETRASEQTAATSAQESVMKSRIEALETLLAQQKKLTEDQYKLLNEAIASKNTTNAVASLPNGQVSSSEEPASSSRIQRSSVVSDAPIVEDVSRNIASVKESQFNTSGTGAGAAAAVSGSASSTSRSSGNSAIADSSSSDSVAREEAKLVNLRQTSTGSIVIESLGTGSTSGNAIAVPISEDQYRMAQGNPTGLNLSQIEKNIPKDQIQQLERRGVITLLLQNGNNPPLEVKVRKQNNRLVQVEDTQIVVRRVSLQGLQNTLKQ